MLLKAGLGNSSKSLINYCVISAARLMKYAKLALLVGGLKVKAFIANYRLRPTTFINILKKSNFYQGKRVCMTAESAR